MYNKQLTMHRGQDEATVYARPSGQSVKHIVVGIIVTNPNVPGIMAYQETMLPDDNEIRAFWEFNRLLCKAQKNGFSLVNKPVVQRGV